MQAHFALIPSNPHANTMVEGISVFEVPFPDGRMNAARVRLERQYPGPNSEAFNRESEMMVYVIAGEVICSANGNKERLGVGHMVLISAQCFYSWEPQPTYVDEKLVTYVELLIVSSPPWTKEQQAIVAV
jgi:hypothetical protein